MAERADIQSVLMQMRTLQAQAQAELSPPVKASAEDGENQSFGELLKTALDSVAATQAKAGELSTAYAQGDTSIGLPEVMIAVQKSSVSFEAAMQVRNRLVRAYQDISKMPI